jgi:probable F420-dependent oxidoreductase
MDMPRFGVGIPSCGPHASPGAIAAVAAAAEGLGLDSLWTFERVLLPSPSGGKSPYPLPESNATVYDPIETLTWISAQTKRIRLGTSVLDALFHPPVVFARRLATLDRLSGGRVTAGVGQGWMPEEFAAVAVPTTRRGAGFEEHLAAVRACWGPDPVEHVGPRYQIARSRIGPKPVQDPLPILIGGTTRSTIERAVRLGDGFATVFVDWDTTATHLGWYRDAGGSGPVVLRVNPEQVDTPGATAPFEGQARSVADDFARAAELGIDEVLWDVNPTAMLPPDRQIAVLESLAATMRPAGDI